MTAFDWFAAAGWLTILGFLAAAICRHLPGDSQPPLPQRTPADVAQSVDNLRAARLAETYPELDQQLDQYAHTIRSLYAEGDR